MAYSPQLRSRLTATIRRVFPRFVTIGGTQEASARGRAVASNRSDYRAPASAIGVSTADANPLKTAKAGAVIGGASSGAISPLLTHTGDATAIGGSSARAGNTVASVTTGLGAGRGRAAANSEQRSAMVDESGDPFTDDTGDTFQLIS